VFESQVLETCLLLGELGVEFRYIITEGLKTWLTGGRAVMARIGELQRDFGIPIRVLFVPSPTSRLGIRTAGRIVAHSAAAESHDQILLKGRGAIATHVALDVKRRLGVGAVLFDCRGDEAAECRMAARSMGNSRARRHWNSRGDRLEQLQQMAGRGADHVLVVSTSLGLRISQASRIPVERTTCVPCCVDPNRFDRSPTARSAIRKELGLEDRVVMVYSGSLVRYQVPDFVADLLSAIRLHLPGIFLLIVTQDVVRAEGVFAELIADGAARIVSADYGDVGRYLAAADMGILLREDDPVNRVASPVKFGEYQAAGLPVIVTPNIGDTSSYVESTGFGIVVDPSAALSEQASRVADQIREKDWLSQRQVIRQAAIRHFSRRAYLEVYRSVFVKMGLRLPEGDRLVGD